MARRKVLTLKPSKVYKVCSVTEWQAALACGSYDGSADDLRDGYVHLSTREQIGGVLDRYFASAPGLMAITVSAEALGPELKWEPNSKGEVFPHLYAALPAAAALEAQVIPDDADERASFVRLLT